MSDCMFPRCEIDADTGDGYMCATHHAIWEADAYYTDAHSAAEELLPPLIQLISNYGNDYLEELLLETQERARRDAALFKEGYKILHEQAREEMD